MKAWRTVSLGEIAESIDYGVTASATLLPKGPKFLRITDIQAGAVDWNSVPWCDCDALSQRKARLLPGDILFARTGATTGKSFLIRECPADAVFASYLIRVRVGSGIEPRYVSHYFQTPDYWAQITASARGAAQPGVNATTLKTLRLRLPSLSEQRRIAEVLDRAEALRAKRYAALAHLNSLTRAIFLDMFGDPAKNPMGWRVARLGDVAHTTSGGTPARSVREYFGGSIPWVKSGELHKEIIEGTEEKLSERGIAESAAKVMPAGSILVAMYGATVGAVAKLGIDAATNQAVCCIQPSPVLSAPYLMHLLRQLTPSLLAKRVGGAQPNLSQELIRDLNIIVAPADIQSEFARRAEIVERLKATQRASMADMEALFVSLQHRAFQGEL